MEDWEYVYRCVEKIEAGVYSTAFMTGRIFRCLGAHSAKIDGAGRQMQRAYAALRDAAQEVAGSDMEGYLRLVVTIILSIVASCVVWKVVFCTGRVVASAVSFLLWLLLRVFVAAAVLLAILYFQR